MKRAIFRCINSHKRIYHFKAGTVLIGGAGGIFFMIIFGFWGAAAGSILFSYLGGKIHDYWHIGKFQTFFYWNFPFKISKFPKSKYRRFV